MHENHTVNAAPESIASNTLANTFVQRVREASVHHHLGRLTESKSLKLIVSTVFSSYPTHGSAGGGGGVVIALLCLSFSIESAFPSIYSNSGLHAGSTPDQIIAQPNSVVQLNLAITSIVRIGCNFRV